jgi:hypothetical protein
MKNEITPIASGLTPEQWVELLKGDVSMKALKAIRYLDGHQEEELVKFLDSPAGRKNWRTRGYIPRYRNLTSMIVEKSGRLFNDTSPEFEIFNHDSTEVNEEATAFLMEELSKIEWMEYFSNLDSVVRLLKTGLVLVQYDLEEKHLVLELLHRGNSAVIRTPSGKIESLIYRVSEEEKHSSYRIITNEEIIDLHVTKTGSTNQIVVSNKEVNSWNMIPVVPFYDTKLPRSGFWVDGGSDLVNMNEMVNIHLTDNEHVISWIKRPTIYTNTKLNSNSDEVELAYDGTSALPRMIDANPSVITGPDKVIEVNSMGVENPFVDYKVPTVDLSPIDQVINNMIKAVASDWSVRVKGTGEGDASSGFQLIVEEIDNLELRKQRQRMFEAGFKRLYRVLKIIFNKIHNKEVFPEDSDLFVTFNHPSLPINPKEQLDVWTKKIESGLANRVQYFVEVDGMTREEAINHIRLLEEENKLLNSNDLE